MEATQLAPKPDARKTRRRMRQTLVDTPPLVFGWKDSFWCTCCGEGGAADRVMVQPLVCV